MCEVSGTHTARELAEILLENDHILIKDLTSKVKNGKQYIRLAVRDKEDNKKMVDALRRIQKR